MAQEKTSDYVYGAGSYLRVVKPEFRQRNGD